MKYLILFGTLMAGSLLPVQNIVNARLGRQTGGPFMSVLISFVIGTIFLLLINIVVNNQAFALVKTAKVTPWYLWSGGFLGALFLTYTTWAKDYQSIAMTFILIICGQIFMALLIDNFGWLGSEIKPITKTQIAGVLLVLAGIFLIRK